MTESTTRVPVRDPQTGELNFKVQIVVHLAGRALPLWVDARDWKAAAAYLRGAEFRRIADRVESVTIANRE